MHLNYLDFILLAPLVYGFIKGLSKGFVFEAASVVALVFGIWGSIHFSDSVAGFLTTRFNWNFQYLNIAAFILTFVGIVLVVNIIAKFIDKIVDMIAMDFLNKLAGGVFGFIKIGIIIGVICFVFRTIGVNFNLISPDVVRDSVVYQTIIRVTDQLLPAINFDQMKQGGEEILKQS